MCYQCYRALSFGIMCYRGMNVASSNQCYHDCVLSVLSCVIMCLLCVIMVDVSLGTLFVPTVLCYQCYHVLSCVIVLLCVTVIVCYHVLSCVIVCYCVLLLSCVISDSQGKGLIEQIDIEEEEVAS